MGRPRLQPIRAVIVSPNGRKYSLDDLANAMTRNFVQAKRTRQQKLASIDDLMEAIAKLAAAAIRAGIKKDPKEFDDVLREESVRTVFLTLPREGQMNTLLSYARAISLAAQDLSDLTIRLREKLYPDNPVETPFFASGQLADAIEPFRRGVDTVGVQINVSAPHNKSVSLDGWSYQGSINIIKLIDLLENGFVIDLRTPSERKDKIMKFLRLAGVLTGEGHRGVLYVPPRPLINSQQLGDAVKETARIFLAGHMKVRSQLFVQNVNKGLA